MHAEVIAVGDEIASGQLLDTNTQWLSLRLEELGIRVLFHSTVGDELAPMVQLFRRAIERSDVIVATGGLGPTADDLTREALAQAAGRPLVLEPAALEHIRRLFARRRREMPASNEVQAMFPQGARVVPNPEGTAPGIDLEVPRAGSGPCRVFALPGVPAEMRQMWHETVCGELRQLGAGGQAIVHRRIKCFGAGESHVEAMLPDLVRRGREPRVGINASQATILLRISATGPTEQAARAATEPVAATIRQCLGNLVFGEEDDELQHAVVRLLRQKKRTLATVEWGTAGLVADWLGDVGGAQGQYLGALTLFGEAAVSRVLEISSDVLARPARQGAELVAAMADECRRRFGSDYALAVGPFPEAQEPKSDTPETDAPEPKPFHLALASADAVVTKAIPFAGHPALLKTLCAKHALNLVRLALLRE